MNEVIGVLGVESKLYKTGGKCNEWSARMYDDATSFEVKAEIGDHRLKSFSIVVY